MLFAYALERGRLRKLGTGDPIEQAAWIDLYRPLPRQIAEVEALGALVPSLEAMQEIELSNRLFRSNDHEHMTIMLPGKQPDGTRIMNPVAFILSPQRMITVRYHAPRPFEIYPGRAETKAAGCKSVDRLFLGLNEEIVSRLADLLEASDLNLEKAGRGIFADAMHKPGEMEQVLDRIAREAEALSRVRLSLMTMERALTYFSVRIVRKREDATLPELVKAELRDIAALTEHVDFVAQRMGQISDAALGSITLQQNATTRTLSVVAALFLPPTLIASIYGMNFAHMPELDRPNAYPMALAAMGASALLSYLYLRWKKWL